MSAPEAIQPEFSRVVELRSVDGKTHHLVATEAERQALAARFHLVRIEQMEADVSLEHDGETVRATGRLSAAIVQSCAVSGEDLPAEIDEPLAFRFVPANEGHQPDEEMEIDEDDCDEIEFTGGKFDLGEAVAQSLALAIDPFAVGPDAERVRADVLAKAEDAGPFAALSALKKD